MWSKSSVQTIHKEWTKDRVDNSTKRDNSTTIVKLDSGLTGANWQVSHITVHLVYNNFLNLLYKFSYDWIQMNKTITSMTANTTKDYNKCNVFKILQHYKFPKTGIWIKLLMVSSFKRLSTTSSWGGIPILARWQIYQNHQRSSREVVEVLFCFR